MDRRKRVVLWTDDPGEGGVAVYSHAILCGLSAAGYEVVCVQSPSDGPMVDRQREVGVQHCWLGFHSRKDFYRGASDLEEAARCFDRASPDVVLFANCAPDSHIAAKTVAIRRNIPFVVVEGFVAPYSNPTAEEARWLGQAAEHYWHAKAVIAVSRDNLLVLRRDYGLPPGKGEVIHYGRPDSYFERQRAEVRQRVRRDFSIPGDAVLCLTIGRLEVVKGYAHLLEVLRELRYRPMWPSLYFAWIGEGSLKAQLEVGLNRIQAADHVMLLGKRWDITDWLDASDVFVLPSYFEGMPLAVMEAMAKGLPVMASAVSGTPEELGDTGKLLPSPLVDPGALAREIVATLEIWARDAGLRSAIGDAGRKRAQALFREDRMVRQTAQVLERAMLPPGD